MANGDGWMFLGRMTAIALGMGLLGATSFHAQAAAKKRSRKPLSVTPIKFSEVCNVVSDMFHIKSQAGEDRFENLLKEETLTAAGLFKPLQKLKWSTFENSVGDREVYSIKSMEFLEFRCDANDGLSAAVRINGIRDGRPLSTEYELWIDKVKDNTLLEATPVFPGSLSVKNPHHLKGTDLLGMGHNITVVALSPYLAFSAEGIMFQLIIPTSNAKRDEANNNFEGEQLGYSYMNAVDQYMARYNQPTPQPVDWGMAIDDTIITFIKPHDSHPTRKRRSSSPVKKPPRPQIIVERLSLVNFAYAYPTANGKVIKKQWQQEAYHSWYLFEDNAQETMAIELPLDE